MGPQVKGPIGTIASITVSCEAGEAAVGGGGTPSDGNWAALLSRPQNSTAGTTGTPRQWRVDFGNYNDTNNAGAVPVAYAGVRKRRTPLQPRQALSVSALQTHAVRPGRGRFKCGVWLRESGGGVVAGIGCRGPVIVWVPGHCGGGSGLGGGGGLLWARVAAARTGGCLEEAGDKQRQGGFEDVVGDLG